MGRPVNEVTTHKIPEDSAPPRLYTTNDSMSICLRLRHSRLHPVKNKTIKNELNI